MVLFVHYHDIYPRNMLVVSNIKIVWVNFDVTTTFKDTGPCEKVYRDYEVELVNSFGKLLVYEPSFTYNLLQ